MKKLFVIGLLSIQQGLVGSEFLGAITTGAKKAANYVKDYYVDPIACLESPETDEILSDWDRLQKQPSSKTFSPTEAQHLRDRFTKRITIAEGQLDAAIRDRDTKLILWIQEKFSNYLTQPYVTKIKNYLEKKNLGSAEKELSGSGTMVEELLSESSKTLLEQLEKTAQALTGTMVQSSEFETFERQVIERTSQAEQQITSCIKTGNTERITKILELYAPHIRPLCVLKARAYLGMQKTAINKVLEPDRAVQVAPPSDRQAAPLPEQPSSSSGDRAIQDAPPANTSVVPLPEQPSSSSPVQEPLKEKSRKNK